MEKYLIQIRITDNFLEVKTEEVSLITNEIKPYLVDLQTLTNFLLLIGRSEPTYLPEHWKKDEFVKIKRIELI